MNRDYGGLDALGSKHVAPWQKPDQDRWPLDSLVGIPGGHFFYEGKVTWRFYEGKGGN